MLKNSTLAQIKLSRYEVVVERVGEQLLLSYIEPSKGNETSELFIMGQEDDLNYLARTQITLPTILFCTLKGKTNLTKNCEYKICPLRVKNLT